MARQAQAHVTREPVQAKPIHPDGLYRWQHFEFLIPFSRETWRQRILQGRAPRPASQSLNCTAYRGADILAWLADPDGYKAVPQKTS
ncbi:helix-turn-helix transcriptional regulator [Achromobacter sp. NPDC008082]|jgi:predicted DNA-binding transcriptional regulator AlpA|uniref:helix-turn-helix transcriptional regulator n=1 Tax=Achromobacter sp. NPDC008082 TaxID=3363888 RepID=UPI0036E74508